MNFCEALKAMQMGSKVSREAWRGEISHCYIPEYRDIITVKYPDGSEKTIDFVFGSEDILADDWWVVT